MTAPIPAVSEPQQPIAPAAPASPAAPVASGAPSPNPVAPAEVPAAPQPPAEPAATAEPEDDLPEWARAKLRKANNEAKNLRDRLKSQEPLVAAAQEAERARMSDLDRANADNAALREQLAARDTEVLQAKYQLTDEDLEFIGGGTFEERSARAAKFAARISAAAPAAVRPPTDTPVSNLRSGATPEAPVVEDNSYPAAWGFQPQPRT